MKALSIVGTVLFSILLIFLYVFSLALIEEFETFGILWTSEDEISPIDLIVLSVGCAYIASLFGFVLSVVGCVCSTRLKTSDTQNQHRL